MCQNHTAKVEAIHPMYPLTGKNLDPQKKKCFFPNNKFFKTMKEKKLKQVFP